jgi:steroid delta-isomerase-like uncharacterized protein
MSDEVLVRLVRQFVEEGHNQGNLKALEQVFAEDAIDHGALPSQAPGREGILQRVAALRAAFPDEHAVVDDMVVQGDRIAFRWTITGTHRGPFQGVAPTGRQIAFTGINIERVRDGRIQEHWSSADLLGLMRQIGGLPSGGAPRSG